jgi:hypothetical protein
MRRIGNALWAVIVGLLVAWCSIFGAASSASASQPGPTDATSLAAGSQGSAEEQFRLRVEQQVCPEAGQLAWAMEGGKGTQALTREAATLENILQGMPTPDPGLSWRLAVAYRALGEHAKAVQVLERFRASWGYVPLKFAELAALCLRAQGNPEGAAAWLDQADSPAGLPPAARAYLGLLNLKQDEVPPFDAGPDERLFVGTADDTGIARPASCMQPWCRPSVSARLHDYPGFVGFDYTTRGAPGLQMGACQGTTTG